METGQLVAGRYRLETPLGRGGMALVFGATDLRLGRQVAVKVLRARWAVEPDIAESFKAEARTVARLSHPNVVAVHDTGEDEGVGYLVMERLPGTTLADELRWGSLPEARVLEVARQVLAGVAAAHEAGIVHGDVKPANVLTCRDGSIKVADFGIATVAEAAPAPTNSGMLIGTLAYLPPERLDGAPIAATTDIYGVGAVLYECLTGRRPFGGDSMSALVAAIRGGRLQPILELRTGVDGALAAVVERALDPDPGRRFASAAAMRHALDTHLAPTGPIVLSDTSVVSPAGPIVVPAKAVWEPARAISPPTVPLSRVTGLSEAVGSRAALESDLGAPEEDGNGPRRVKRGVLAAVLAAAMILLPTLFLPGALGAGAASRIGRPSTPGAARVSDAPRRSPVGSRQAPTTGALSVAAVPPTTAAARAPSRPTPARSSEGPGRPSPTHNRRQRGHPHKKAHHHRHPGHHHHGHGHHAHEGGDR